MKLFSLHNCKLNTAFKELNFPFHTIPVQDTITINDLKGITFVIYQLIIGVIRHIWPFILPSFKLV
jgi:hypothetical protein